MLIRARVQINRQVSECPYEADGSNLIIDVWSPLSSSPNRPYRLVQTRNQTCSTVTSRDQLEAEKIKRNSGECRLLAYTHPDCQDKGQFEIELTADKTKHIAPHEVVCVFYFYTHQARHPVSQVPSGIRHTSTAVLFGSQLHPGNSTLSLYSTHHVETKWIKRARRHVRLDITILESTVEVNDKGSPRPSRYWEDVLERIWRDGIQPDIDWVRKDAVDFHRRCQVMTPLSVPVHGVPVAYVPEEQGKVYNDQYPVSKGLTAQSLWYMPVEEIVTDDWIRKSMLDVLRLRDANWADFIRPPLTEEEHQKRLSDVVKLVTYHASTWPYFPDAVAVRNLQPKGSGGGSITHVPIDDMDPARIKPGDCEDVASITIQITNDIMRRRNVQCPLIRQVQRYLTILGVPCGACGLLQGSDSLHVFGIFIPVPLFCSLLGITPPPQSTSSSLGDERRIPLHCALIEGTVLSSPYYTLRERVSSKKLAVCSQIESILRVEGGEGEGDVEWHNYCIPQAWSLRPDIAGRHVHSSVLRIFPCMPELVLGDWAKTVIKRSYVLHQTNESIGIPALELLSRFQSVGDFKAKGWSAEATHDVPCHVIALEREVIRHFYRPVTPITYGPDPVIYMNKAPFEVDVQTNAENAAFKRLVQRYQCSTMPILKDPNRRVVLYIWKLDSGSSRAEMLIDKIVSLAQVQVKHVQRLGHGFAVVFYIPT